jgi:hypothetical protein
MILDDDGYIVKCDICDDIRDYNHTGNREHCDEFCNCSGWRLCQHDNEIQNDLWPEIVKSLNIEIFPRFILRNIESDLCRDCASHLTKWIAPLSDVIYLKTFVNKLERSINAKRKEIGRIKDNRTT